MDFYPQIAQRFTKQFISVDKDWLKDCIEWFVSEESMISAEDLFKKSYEQWLLADLCELDFGCLPASIDTRTESYQLVGSFSLQIQFIVDIAESSYEQLRLITDNKLDEAEDERRQNANDRQLDKKKRMLKIALTDGKKSITGMEYSRINCLTTNILPGSKILISGPVRCVNRVLFLEEKNCRLLGGEVDTMLIENATENIIRRNLGKSINPEPIKLNTQSYNTQATNNTLQQCTRITENNTVTSEIAHFSEALNYDQNMEDEDDMFLEIDLQSVVGHSNNSPPRDNVSYDEETNSNVLQSLALSHHSTSIDDKNYQFRIRGCNLVTIDELNSLNDDKKDGLSFILKAEVDAVAEKLQINAKNWCMAVFLKDNSEDLLKVHLSNNVISKMADTSALEMISMRKLAKKQPELQTQMREVLSKLQNELMAVNCFHKISFAEVQSPTVVELIESAPYLEKILKQKLDEKM